MWPARMKSVARSRPPWQDVQPNVAYGCGEFESTKRSRRGCVRSTDSGYFCLSSKPRVSAAMWHVMQRSTRWLLRKFTSFVRPSSWTCWILSDGASMSAIGALRTK